MKTDIAFSRALAAVAAAGLAVLTARADLIYWMVNNPVDMYRNNNPLTFEYATIKADGATLNVYDQSGDTGFSYLYADDETGKIASPAYSGSFSDSVTSFLVELWNAEDKRVGWRTYTKEEMLAAGSIWKEDGVPAGGVSVFAVGQVIPEPTSGLLLLLGGALLALRRRRAC